MKYEHPTGNRPNTIAIIGLGPTSQDWHAAHVQYTPPVEVVDEVWTVNKGFRTVKCDMCFIMDDLVDENRKSVRYGEEIAQISKKMPILTSTVDHEVCEKWPDVHRYPLEDVLRYWGNHLTAIRIARSIGLHEAIKSFISKPTKDNKNKIDSLLDSYVPEYKQKQFIDPLELGKAEAAYFNNSIPYMLAYAGMIGVNKIYLFGCDYDFPGSAAREADKANAEHWIGNALMGLGIVFRYPHRTTLMSRNNMKLYGFNGRPPF